MNHYFKLVRTLILLEIGLFALSHGLIISAQKIENFSNKEGFNQNTITAINQDRYGFIWFGTPNGLFKYDGYEFKAFTTQFKGNGHLISNHITTLFNDKDGLLWIGTDEGLNVYIPWLEKFLPVPVAMNLKISHIARGPNGQIWFSGKDKLYSCKLLSAESGEFAVSSNVLKSFSKTISVNCFCFKDHKSVLLATPNGLKKVDFKMNPSTHFPVFKTLTDCPVFKNSYITKVLNVNNVFWVGTTKGILKASFEDDRAYLIAPTNLNDGASPILTHYEVTTLVQDRVGVIWIGTKENGIYKYNQKEDSYTHYFYDPKNKVGLSSNHINAIFRDEFDVVWMGTAQGGINKLDYTQKPFFTYTNNPYDPSSIADNLITSIIEDQKGYLWISGYKQALFKSTQSITKSTVQHLKFQNLSQRIPLPPSDIVRTIFEDKRGFIWLGTDLAVVVYNPSTTTFKRLHLNYKGITFPELLCHSIRQLDDNTMLLAGKQILILENPWEQMAVNSATIPVKSFIKIAADEIQTVLLDQSHSYWFGTNNGLFKGVFKNGQINIQLHITGNKNQKIHLSSNNVFCLHQDTNGEILIGTFGSGLNKMTLNKQGFPIKMVYFIKNNLLADDAIYGILPENKNILWISTDKGLIRFHIPTFRTDVFDVRDGLAQNNFRQGAYFKGKSGYFYFGGLNGLTVFKPADIVLNNHLPKVLITDLFINNKAVKIGEELNNRVVLEKSISETNEITISQNQQMITFNLAVKHTASPSKNKLAYKLEGFNDTWVEKNSGKATITYTNLSAGKYIFKVKASNGDGVWSPATKNLKILILPPWYQTWWSYILFLLLIIAVCIGIIVYFVKLEVLKQHLKYEKLDKERSTIINNGKVRYFTNLSHEFRTPLTLIAGPLERIIAQNKEDSNVKYLTIIEKNTKRLLSLVNQLITFHQAENGFVKLHLSKISLGEFIYSATEAFEDFALQKNINFFYKVSSPNEEIIIDVEKVERIIFNLLSNSFKNTPAQGIISVEANILIMNNKKVICIDVIDNGKGIPKEYLNDIFERFYQLGNKEGTISGGGIGLAFCQSLINLLGGTISVKSEMGEETRFSVVIPSKEVGDNASHEIHTDPPSFMKDFIPLVKIKSDEVETISLNNQLYTILIVEDEEDMQHFLMSFLSEKYNIILANNGQEGLEVLNTQEPHLIISDIMMAGMDGFEFCEKIKANPATCQIPVLLLTALEDTKNMIKGLELGADEYISKPFSLRHLELRIEKLISNTVKIKEYFSKKSTIPDDGLEISNKDRLFLEQIIKAIEKNISNSGFGVEELASEIGLSSSQFYKRLKQLTGQIPNVYLRNFRLQRAAELLKSNEGFNVTEVMYEIGIESSSYFSTAFKKLHGVSPSEFLKK